MVIIMYLMLGFLGIAHLLGIANHQGMTEMIGEGWVNVWGCAQVIASLLALTGAWLAPREHIPIYSQAVEASGCVLALVTKGLYSYSLVRMYGWEDVAVNTLAMALAISIGSGARLVQIIVEQWALKASIQKSESVKLEAVAHANNKE